MLPRDTKSATKVPICGHLSEKWRKFDRLRSGPENKKYSFRALQRAAILVSAVNRLISHRGTKSSTHEALLHYKSIIYLTSTRLSDLLGQLSLSSTRAA